MFTKIGGSYIPNKNATQTILQTLSEKTTIREPILKTIFFVHIRGNTQNVPEHNAEHFRAKAPPPPFSYILIYL